MSTGYAGRIVPAVGDTSVRLPITLDHSTGRSQATKSSIIWSSVAFLGIVVVDIGILFSGMPIFTKIASIVILTYVGMLGIRFVLLKEHKHRKEMKKRIAEDYQIQMTDFWGIHEIRGNMCYFRNGQVGMFVMLEKDSTVGTAVEDQFEHYEALSDAFNNMGVSKLRVNHIDLMDIVGRDDRIRRAYLNMMNYENGHVKSVLEKIFSNLQKEAETSVTSYDVFLFMYSGNEAAFDQVLRKVIACFMAANYASYLVLDKKRIQVITSALFNLNQFSINEATSKAFRGGKNLENKIRVLTVDVPGKPLKVVNKSREEERAIKQQEAEFQKAKSRELARRQQEAKNRRRGKDESTPAESLLVEEAIDLDEATGILGDEDDFFSTRYLASEEEINEGIDEEEESFGDIEFSLEPKTKPKSAEDVYFNI